MSYKGLKTKPINWAAEVGYLLSTGKLKIANCGHKVPPENIDDWSILLLALAVYRHEEVKPRIPFYITACALRIPKVHRQWFVSACRKYSSLRALDLLPQGVIGGVVEKAIEV